MVKKPNHIVFTR